MLAEGLRRFDSYDDGSRRTPTDSALNRFTGARPDAMMAPIETHRSCPPEVGFGSYDNIRESMFALRCPCT